MGEANEAIKTVVRIMRRMIDKNISRIDFYPEDSKVVYGALGEEVLNQDLYSQVAARLEIIAGIDMAGEVGEGRVRIFEHDFAVSSSAAPSGKYLTLKSIVQHDK